LEHGLLAGFIVTASYVVGGGKDALGALLLYFSALFAEVFLFTMNDLHNIEEDRVNRPTAPLVTGEVPINVARALAYSSLTLSLLLPVPGLLVGSLSYRCVPILVIALALGQAYNLFLKRIVLVNNAVVSLVSSLTFIYGLYASGNVLVPLPHLFFLASFLSTMGRELVKGIIDAGGDSLVGIRTVASTMGAPVAIRLAAAFTYASAASSVPIVILSLGEAAGYVLALGTLVTDASLIYLSLRLMRIGEAYSGIFRRYSLVSMAIAIVSYLVYSLLRLLGLP
jgi:geranylgeranylglycerol-phosphate geranylgeranyltransferase